MTENKLPNETLENAIGVYKTTIDVCQNVDDEDYNPNFDKVTVAFLEELQQYRAIGTVEEFKALKEKNEPKRFAWHKDMNGIGRMSCPTCLKIVPHEDYCCNCGQRINWE